MDPGNGRGKRIKILTADQKAAIANLTSSSQIPHKERKRHWNAFYRRLEHKDLPEGLLEKWSKTSSDHGKFHTQRVQCVFKSPSLSYDCLSCKNKVFMRMHVLTVMLQTRFEFLKCFLMDPSLQSMHIEAFHIEPKPKIGSANAITRHNKP